MVEFGFSVSRKCNLSHKCTKSTAYHQCYNAQEARSADYEQAHVSLPIITFPVGLKQGIKDSNCDEIAIQSG